METRLVMITSALLLLAHGLVLLFAPELLLHWFSLGNSPEGSMAAQLFGAALVGLGLMNWTARGLVLGGIYGRALVFGNFAYTLISFFVGIRARVAGIGNAYFWIEVGVFLVYAFVFGVMLFQGPIPQTTQS